MKFKKWISAFLVMVLILTSFAIPTSFTSTATENEETNAEAVEEKNEDEKVSDVSETEQTENDEDSIEDKDVQETDDVSGENKDQTNISEENQNNAVEDQKSEELNENNNPQLYSLLPLQEVNAYLVLNDYSEEQIKAMPLGDVLGMLRDSEGNVINISEDATAVWTYYKDENDNVIRDEYHVIDKEETVDLSLFEYSRDYTMELIVGSGKQLDPGNVRYLVKVYLSNTISENIGYELYSESADGTRTEVTPQRVFVTNGASSSLGIEDMTLTSIDYMLPEHQANTEYYLGMTSEAAKHPDIKADVYTMEELLKELWNPGTGQPITDQILDQNMEQEGAGYKGVFDVPTSVYDWKNMFFIIYTDISNDSIISFAGVTFSVANDMSYMTSELFSQDEGQSDIVCEYTQYIDVKNFDINMDSGSLESSDGIHGEYYMLEKGYSADDEYYCALNAHSSVWDDDANGHVVKAVVGHYNTLEEAEGQKDIKEQLIPTEADRDGTAYGYKANYNREKGGVDFTVFFDDGNVWKFNVWVMEYNPEYDTEYMQSFNDAPVVGAQDPWFRVTGANNADGDPLDTYIVENGKEINMDTMYGYGYQTILINEDVSEIQPTFWKAESDDVKVTNVYINEGEPFEEGDAIECVSPETNVTFHVTIEDSNGKHTKNYNVSFVKKGSGPQLYVADPKGSTDDAPVRSVFLDEYFEFKHDIFIANTGDEELTGLRVELNATNVKLDDYWTVGGEGNDTLAPFTTTSVTTQYGELANIAKIRLLPDGDGDIEGTLTIYADNQEPVTIKLSGRAQNPHITTNAVDDAVKYVPYSYMITTNNMYDWTNVEFAIEGELPEGVEFIESTGEIYGVPQETGEFPISITAEFVSDTYKFEPSTVDLTLTVNDNTNENVYEATDEEYQILEPIGTDASGTYDFVLTDTGDQLFVSNGEFDEFQDLWLNGEKLIEGVDYTKEAGSTRITISSQTFQNKVDKNGSNTIAAEFRVDNKRNNELKRTAQNFRLNLSSGNNGGNNSSGGSGSGWTGGYGSGGGYRGGSSGTGSSAYVSPYVTMIAQLVDKQNNPLEGYTVELHSTPKSAQTDSEGKVRFKDVDFGNHTITVKDRTGNVAASKSFIIAEGSGVSLKGDTVTARRGSSFMLKVTLDGNTLNFENIEEIAAQTGDNMSVWLYTAMAFMAVTATAVIVQKRRKNR